MQNTLRTTLFALMAIALPAALVAQQGAAQEDVAQERTEIQSRLAELQQQVLQEPEIQAAQAEVGAMLMAAMERVDSTLEQKAERAQQLQQEALAAQAAEDEATLQALMQEAQELQAAFTRARAAAMEDEETAAAIEALQERIVNRMTELDPETPTLIARLEALSDG